MAGVFVTVSHRMIPFFSASAIPKLDAWRPFWLLWVSLFVLWFEGLVAISAWTLATCAWSLRYGSWFGRPRLDGRPG